MEKVGDRMEKVGARWLPHGSLLGVVSGAKMLFDNPVVLFKLQDSL